jgi:hypothetical protein
MCHYCCCCLPRPVIKRGTCKAVLGLSCNCSLTSHAEKVQQDVLKKVYSNPRTAVVRTGFLWITS